MALPIESYRGFSGDHSCKAESTAVIDAKHFRFLAGKLAELLQAKLGAKIVPFEPQLPAAWKPVCDLQFHETCFLPMSTPPRWRMEAAEVPLPVPGQMGRRKL